MTSTSEITTMQIAPCGMSCGICIGYLRDKKKCLGCRVYSEFKPEYCKKCIIINCEYIKESGFCFCYECPKYPCRRLKQLDKRYKNKYHMSMLENLEMIKEEGIEAFLKKEDAKWTCWECQSRLSAHRNGCIECGAIIFTE